MQVESAIAIVKPRLALMGLCLLLAGLFLMVRAPLQPIAPGKFGAVHSPTGAPIGTVLCVHSIFQDEEGGWPVAQAMARAGFAAVNVALPRGRSFEEYVARVNQAADASQPPVYLWGHSMGADLVAASRSPKIKATVTTGFPTEGSHQLSLVGAWDELHSVEEFHRPVHVLRLADHDGENFDVGGFRIAAAHFGGTDPGWADPFSGRALLAYGIILVVTGTASRWRPAIVASLALLLWRFDPLHTASRALLLGLCIAQGEADWLKRRQVIAIYLGVTLGLGLNAWSNIFGDPTLLLQLPLMLVPIAFQLWTKCAGLLSWPAAMAILILELARPGAVMPVLTYLPRKLWTTARIARFQIGSVSKPHLTLLILLLAAAAFCWHQVVVAGYAPDSGQAIVIASRLSCLLLIPAAVYLGLARLDGISAAVKTKRAIVAPRD